MSNTLPAYGDEINAALPLVGYKINICGLLELEMCCADDISHVLSLVDPNCAEEELDAFANYPKGHYRLELRLEDVIDQRAARSLPPEEIHIKDILNFGRLVREQQGTHVLIHCHAGKSRSTAATAMILADTLPPGDEDKAFAALRQIRHPTWPNSLMIDMADALMNRNGDLSRALRRHFQVEIERSPDFVDYIREIRPADFEPFDNDVPAQGKSAYGANQQALHLRK